MAIIMKCIFVRSLNLVTVCLVFILWNQDTPFLPCFGFASVPVTGIKCNLIMFEDSSSVHVDFTWSTLFFKGR